MMYNVHVYNEDDVMGRLYILMLALAAFGLGEGRAQVALPGSDTSAATKRQHVAQKRIGSFDQLMEVLEGGGQVRAVFHYARCRMVVDGDTTRAPEAVGGMELSSFEYFAPKSVGNESAFVSSSQTALIARGKGHVYNYVKLRLYQDGRAEITARYLEPPKMKVRMDEKFLGRLDDGLNQGGVSLFQIDICRPCSCSRP